MMRLGGTRGGPGSSGKQPPRNAFPLKLVRVVFPVVMLSLAVSSQSEARQAADPASACDAVPGADRSRCLLAVQAADMLRPGVSMAYAGGSPVPGTYSTLGMRVPGVPRGSVSIRGNYVRGRAPDLLDLGREEVRPSLASVSLDGVLGLVGGVSLLPGVGGIGSLDLLAGTGVIRLPTGAGFQSGTLLGWTVGLRLGLLRESFIVPGVSVTGSYRRLETVEYGDPELGSHPAYVRFEPSAWSVRGGVSKQVFGVGVGIGAGYDRYSGDTDLGVLGATGGGAGYHLTISDHDGGRYATFANVSWTTLVFHTSVEAGWQWGSNQVPGHFPPAVGLDAEAGSLLLSVAFRISI